MNLLDFDNATQAQLDAAATILVSALAHVPSAWKDREAAAAEVAAFIDNPERSAILALDDEAVVGWIGAIRQSEFAWELHPLVVAPAFQRRGIGTGLVAALEARARAEGVITIWLGTDDDFGGTNLFGRNLFPDVLENLRGLYDVAGHPFRFYERSGYVVTGVLPDVDGHGRHDILMAKRISNGGARKPVANH